MQVDRYNYLVDVLLSAQQPVLLTGDPGVGKTCLVQVRKTQCIQNQVIWSIFIL